MELIGHCAVAAKSGVHTEQDVFGEGVIELMIPNILHCHDWGYQHVWEVENFPDDLHYVVTQIRAHIIADWIIHYGAEQTSVKRKSGWAYKHMGLAHGAAEEFFEEAMKLDLLSSSATHPSTWSKKKRLDFSHSITEYALDFILAPSLITKDRLKDIKRNLLQINQDNAPKGRKWLWATFERLGATTDQQEEMIGRGIEELALDAETAQAPEDFAVGTTLRKYGFHLDIKAGSFVRQFLERVADSIDQQEADEMCVEIAGVIADPAKIYTGPWRDTASAAE